MKRNFPSLLMLTALATSVAFANSAFAGKGFSLGGGHPAGRSLSNHANMQFKSPGNHFARQLNQSGPALTGRTIKHHAPNLSQTVNRTFPQVNPNVLQGNVRNNLLGNASGMNPKLGIAKGAPPVGGHVGNVLAGQGHANIGKQVSIHVGGTPRKGKADCRHVIDMLIRHSVGNRSYDPCIKHRCPDPMWAQVGWIPAPVFVAPVGAPAMGDLELVEVGMVSDASPEQGPLYQVTVRNVGSTDAEHFRVSLVAVLGEIAEDSPSVTINVDRIAAGETATLQVQMPVGVMSLGAQGAAAAPFDTLVVAIDSFDELVESNELNNMATLKRAEVQLIQVGVTATTEAAAPVEQTPASGDAPTAPQTTPTAPEGEAPKDNGGLDLEDLGLDDADGAAELFTR